MAPVEGGRQAEGRRATPVTGLVARLLQLALGTDTTPTGTSAWPPQPWLSADGSRGQRKT